MGNKRNENEFKNPTVTWAPCPDSVPANMPKAVIQQANLNKLKFCPECNTPLVRGYTLAPVNSTTVLKFHGIVCNHCKRLYISPLRKAEESLAFYLRVAEIEFYKSETNYQRDANRRKEAAIRKSEMPILKEMFNRYEGSIASFFIAPCDESKEDSPSREFIVITSNKNVCNSDKRYIFYTSEFARNILAILNQYSDIKLVKDGIEYKILNSYDCELESRYIPWPFWTVGKGGGLKKGNDEKFVDLLIYSAKTKRYEILRATENSNDKCYSDISLYKNFVKRYGLTDLKAQPVTRQDENYNINGFLSLNEKSVLMECGYNVKSNSRMSPNERQTLLSDIIALKILDKESIVKHLESCISLHKSEKYDDARDKWSDDLDYILSFDNSEGTDKFYFLRQI